MVFAERSIRRCEELFSSGTVVELVVCNILRCENIDVTRLEPFLYSLNTEVRLAAVRIIGEKGSIEALLNAAIKESDDRILIEMMKYLGIRRGGVDALDRLLRDENSIIREEAISMFRRAGETEKLFPLIFDENNAIVQRIKGYLDEQG